MKLLVKATAIYNKLTYFSHKYCKRTENGTPY